MGLEDIEIAIGNGGGGPQEGKIIGKGREKDA